MKIIAGIMLAFFLLYRAVLFYSHAFHGFAWDYSVNWTAALAWREGVSLYDRPALHELALSHIGNSAQALFSGRFTSFVGLPTTAIIHLPFSYIPYEASALCYRVSALLAMVMSIVLTGLALPAALRTRAWLVGVLCLLSWNAFPFSLQLGQVDAWVMLALATVIFAVSRERWTLAGAGIAVAVLLKISPVWLLLFCLLKRQWSVVFAAATCLAAGAALACLPQLGSDLQQFITVVLPSLGDSPLHVQNQALGAFLARLTTPDTRLLSFAVGIGWWKTTGAGFAALLLVLLYRATRNTPLQTDELAAAILLALLAGPLTWDHYLSWAIIPVMLLSARLSVGALVLLIVVSVPLVFPVPYLKEEIIAANGWWRVLTGLQTSVLLVLAGWIIWRCYCSAHQVDRSVV